MRAADFEITCRRSCSAAGILSCQDRYDASTREAVSRLIAAALSNPSVSPSRASRHAD